MRIPRLLFLPIIFCLVSFNHRKEPGKGAFPYKEQGFTTRQAAAHLLNRFTFGYTQGMLDEVVKMGPENWFMQQLDTSYPDDSLKPMLTGYPAVSMTGDEIATHFADPGKLVKMAIADGLFSKEEINGLKEADKKAYRRKLLAYMKQKGMEPRAALNRQLISQKILRAVFSQNQLQEVLTSFWFNHFNVSLSKPPSANYTLAYERDVIRPNSLGNFENLLLATARSPAMLIYLDNDKSRVENTNATPRQQRQQQEAAKMIGEKLSESTNESQAGEIKNLMKTRGLNENYAREVMELHTLGVDGGYTQEDVTEGARILTGWMAYPSDGPGRQYLEKIQDRFSKEQLEKRGFVHEGDFLFAANRHDYGSKKFLGKNFPAGEGYSEGLAFFHTLASHPSTAKFICRKLATRFVQDNPPGTLVDRMAESFLKSKGDIKKVLLTMVYSPEFWQKSAYREKIKSPFELVVSAVRCTGASITDPYPLYTWMQKMGEPIYSYQAPTGFPYRAAYWINTGSLLYRMNFGMAFALEKIPGVNFNPQVLVNYHEPESMQAALEKIGASLLPERDLEPTMKRLLPLLNDPSIESKIAAAAGSAPADSTEEMTEGDMRGKIPALNSASKEIQLAQVTGILLGCPEFQRR
jgi:uncharacterized protein (DUF1800 family)